MTTSVVEYRDGIVKYTSPATGRIYQVRLLREHAHRLGEPGWSRRLLRRQCRTRAEALEYRQKVVRRLRYLRIIGRLVDAIAAYRMDIEVHSAALNDLALRFNELRDALESWQSHYGRLERLRLWIREVLPWIT